MSLLDLPAGAYFEYPVRCLSCGEPVAERVAEFERNLNSMSLEAALDTISMRYCTRTTLMRPTIRYLNVLDDNKINGTTAGNTICLDSNSVIAGGPNSRRGQLRQASSVIVDDYTPTVRDDDRHLGVVDIVKETEANAQRAEGHIFSEIGLPVSYMDPQRPIHTRELCGGSRGQPLLLKEMNTRKWAAL